LAATQNELVPGTFWRDVADCTRRALENGALVSISTRCNRIEDHGVSFVVRVSDNLLRKRKAPETTGQSVNRNPFLPPDPALTVGTLPPHHVAVLNKFNVLPNHVLVVTRGFEHQEQPLTAGDFSAVAAGLDGNSLAFYNGGKTAGASQPHKHFQLVPLPLGEPDREHEPGIPMDTLFHRAGSGIDTVPALRFRHAFTRLDADPADRPAFGGACLRAYTAALEALGMSATGEHPDTGRLPPYNLLLTGHWLLLVPRQVEHYQGISVNGLGYAGSLFVSSPDKLEQVRAAGPMRILEAVSIPAT
jgi:ATP adenylyltransferase